MNNDVDSNEFTDENVVYYKIYEVIKDKDGNLLKNTVAIVKPTVKDSPVYVIPVKLVNGEFVEE